ncbi:MAG: hypothetical protein DRJ97_07540 [Thermoprotei archaeon]|nr:MAG: hypothetical protein DRJ97_07540 [Thermoprotei archaeon]
MDLSLRLRELVASCEACSPVDKPLIKFEAYTRWLPKQVKVLAIGESPPPGFKESVFYNLEVYDRFRRAMKLVLGVKGDEEVLVFLKSRGVFITGAVKCRPRSRAELGSMRRSCVPMLRAELELLKPKRVVAMGRAAASSISELLGVEPPLRVEDVKVVEAGGLEVAFTPHPNYIFRFRRDLAPKLRELLVS